MGKQLVTAEDVTRAAAGGVRRIAVAGDALVTDLAREQAERLGVVLDAQSKPARPAADRDGDLGGVDRGGEAGTSPSDDLEARVRRLVGQIVGDARPGSVPPIRRVDARSVTLEPFPFDIDRPAMDVRTTDVITDNHGSPMGAGFMTLREGRFPWTFTYDEVEYVIEGELHITTPQETFVGLPGDVLFVPKGSEISFGTPSWAKFLYVTYPAEWGEG